MAVQSKAGSDSQADINLPVEDQDTKYENTPPPTLHHCPLSVAINSEYLLPWCGQWNQR